MSIIPTEAVVSVPDHDLPQAPQIAAEALAHHQAAVVSSNVARTTTMTAQATADANGFAILVFPVCPQGRQQSVKRLTIGGANWGASAPGSAVAFVDSMTYQPDVDVPIMRVVDQATSLPNVAYYLDDQIVITPGSCLQVQIYGGTSGDVYYGAAAVRSIPL